MKTALNAIKGFVIGLILFIVATIPIRILTLVALVFTVLYYIIFLKWITGLSRAGKYYGQVALSQDQFANVSLQQINNLVMIKRVPEAHLFGDEDDTLSYCVAMNQKNGTGTKFAKLWENLLNTIDPGHLQKALAAKDKRDFEAVDRLIKKGLLIESNGTLTLNKKLQK